MKKNSLIIILTLLSFYFILPQMACYKIKFNTPKCIKEKIKNTKCLERVDEYKYNGKIVYYFTGDFRGEGGGSCYHDGCSFLLDEYCNKIIDTSGKIVCECGGGGNREPDNCIDFNDNAVFVRKIYTSWF